MATTPEQELQELKSELAGLKTDMQQIAETMAKLARATAEQGRERIMSATEHSRRQAKEALGVLEKEVEERPMTSLAIALGVGFVLGKLFDR